MPFRDDVINFAEEAKRLQDAPDILLVVIADDPHQHSTLPEFPKYFSRFGTQREQRPVIASSGKWIIRQWQVGEVLPPHGVCRSAIRQIHSTKRGPKGVIP